MTPSPCNVAGRLTAMARAMPDAVAVVEPLDYDRRGRRRYRQFTFRELDEDSDRIARGLAERGVPRGSRLALLVRPGVDFISLVFGLLKAGMVSILIDPGMGRRNLVRCLEEAEPEGFVAIPPVHAVRVLLRRRFPAARFNVTVGRRWFWGGATLGQFRRRPHAGSELAPTAVGRSGGDHLHHRQHRPAQGRPLHPRHLRHPGRGDPRLLRHQAGRDRPAGLSAVRAVQLRDGRDGRHSRHGPLAAGSRSIPRRSSKPSTTGG